MRSAYPGYGSIKIKMGSSFRWNDELELMADRLDPGLRRDDDVVLAPLPSGEGLG